MDPSFYLRLSKIKNRKFSTKALTELIETNLGKGDKFYCYGCPRTVDPKKETDIVLYEKAFIKSLKENYEYALNIIATENALLDTLFLFQEQDIDALFPNPTKREAELLCSLKVPNQIELLEILLEEADESSFDDLSEKDFTKRVDFLFQLKKIIQNYMEKKKEIRDLYAVHL